MVRDVDQLEDLQDDQIRKLDQEYLERHDINQLIGGLMTDILKLKPKDPVQFMIDCVALGAENATQDAVTGLPLHRQAKLEQVFKLIDKEQAGKISLRSLQEYANKYGGETLTLTDLQALFKDFKPANDLFICMPEFLLFFSKVSRTISNKDFEAMIQEMAA